MWMGLKLTTPPTSEPVSLAEVKAHLRIDGDSEDTYLGTLIAAAREDCEAFQNRAYVTQTWELTLDKWPQFPVKLPMSPLINATSIKYYDTANVETTWDASNYFVDTDSEPGRIDLAYNISLPTTTLRPINGVKILFVAGYGDSVDVPQATKQAMLLLIGHYYENREATSDKKMEELPMAVSSLLWKNRLVPI